MPSWLQKDHAIALLLLLALNLWVGRLDVPEASRARVLGHRAVSERIDELERTRDSLDLVILGDSRSERIDVPKMCERLALERCANLSSLSGDWVTTHEFFGRIEPLLAPDAIVLLGVSDYWLEMGGRHALGMIPRTLAYAELGDPASTIASFLPLSVHRASLWTGLHETVSRSLALPRVRGGAPEGLVPSELDDRSNVDTWFRPIREPDRRDAIARARRVLRRLGAGADLRIVHLPNAPRRERYVDVHYPGRRERFAAELDQLLAELGVPLLTTSELPDDAFRDFHHLNQRGKRRVLRELTEQLARIRDDAG